MKNIKEIEYCKYCGKEVKKEPIFCPHCGSQLKPIKTEIVLAISWLWPIIEYSIKPMSFYENYPKG